MTSAKLKLCLSRNNFTTFGQVHLSTQHQHNLILLLSTVLDLLPDGFCQVEALLVLHTVHNHETICSGQQMSRNFSLLGVESGCVIESDLLLRSTIGLYVCDIHVLNS